VDTGPDPRTEIRNCDLVMLVYDCSSEESIARLGEHWLPIIHALTKEKPHLTPVVIVGNKSDRVHLPVDQEMDHSSVKDVLKGLTYKYKQVQMGIECSALYNKNIKKVLNSAQRAVLYPLGPLYDLTNKKITPKFRKALLRIFRILDIDLSGRLSDRDLSGLQ
jgi:mitochondrial Rho GTPase 1